MSKKKWYALFVHTGKEDDVSKYLINILDQQINFSLLVPKRELYEYKSGVKVLCQKTLFPGYILVETDSIEEMYKILKSSFWHSDLNAFLRQGKHFEEIQTEEIAPILLLIDDKGIIRKSEILVKPDRIVIMNGPLVNFQGSIKKVNRRKGRAKITMEFLNRVLDIDISIECINDKKEICGRNVIMF